MKIFVQVLNYDSVWVTYCVAQSELHAQQAVADLRYRHNFQQFQIQVVKP